MQTLYPRLVKCAEAGALATETRLETQYLGGILEIVPNRRSDGWRGQTSRGSTT